MVDWEYWRVCIVVLAVQLVAIYVSSMVIGLVVYVGSYVLALVAVALASSNMPKIYKMSVLVLVLFTVYTALINLRWNVVTLSTFIAILAWIVALLEVIFDEIAYKHSFKVPDAVQALIGLITGGYWEIVAAVRLGNGGGYASNQFQDVIVCDKIESNDDPFGPEHTSFVHFVEIRRHNFAWKEMIVWRVSMLSGAQTSVARKQFVAFNSPFNRRFVADRLECFESRGIVFAFVVVPFFRQHRKKLLYVFDTNANGKSGQFTLPDNIVGNRFASISCLQRIIRPNGEVSGWRIRLLTVRDRMDDQGDFDFYLAKYETELREGSNGPTIFGVSIMSVGNFTMPRYHVVRTSDGMFGVYVRSDVNGVTRVLLYDPACDVYVFCADLEELGKLDKAFAVYIERKIPSAKLQPTVFTDRECIALCYGWAFFRMEIQPASLLYTAAKRIFREDPSLKSWMNAAEFRNRTGMDRMSAHFEP